MALNEPSNEIPSDRSPRAGGPSAGGGEDWVARFFRDVDTFRIEKLGAWMGDDIEVRFGNAAAVHGERAAVASFDEFFGAIVGIRHTREALVADGDAAVQIGTVTYVRHDGSEVSLRCASHLRRSGPSKLDRLWIYMDIAPLFAPAEKLEAVV